MSPQIYRLGIALIDLAAVALRAHARRHARRADRVYTALERRADELEARLAAGEVDQVAEELAGPAVREVQR